MEDTYACTKLGRGVKLLIDQNITHQQACNSEISHLEHEEAQHESFQGQEVHTKYQSQFSSTFPTIFMVIRVNESTSRVEKWRKKDKQDEKNIMYSRPAEIQLKSSTLNRITCLCLSKQFKKTHNWGKFLNNNRHLGQQRSFIHELITEYET